MIGYYVHHQGRGHQHRAQALAGAWGRLTGESVTGLSSSPRPATWSGDWVQLPRDDDAEQPVDVTAQGQLHWAPLGDPGHRSRMAAVARWVEQAQPRAVVADVSAEVATLVRLHGVPVVSVVLPGRRADPAHLLGFRLSSALVGAWPEAAENPPSVTMTPGLPWDVRERLVPIGAVSRFAPADGVGLRPAGAPRAVLLQGRGGEALSELTARQLEARLPGWHWTVLGGSGDWVEDPVEVLRRADVVVTGAGQGSVADVAALRRPAVVVPGARPHDEQVTSAAVLAAGAWPVVVSDSAEQALRSDVLEQAARLEGARWSPWCDGLAADRFARVIQGAALDVSQGPLGVVAAEALSS